MTLAATHPDDHGLSLRAPGDIQAAVVRLVHRLAPIVPVSHQPALAHRIAEVIASKASTMAFNMFLRQSIIRERAATHAQMVAGLASWVTVLFDLDNLQHDRKRALDVEIALPREALQRLTDALSKSRNGCILAVPHIGSIELLGAYLVDQGLNVGFVYSIGEDPTPVEQWIYRGRYATLGTPIAFNRRNTGAEISRVLGNNGVVFMIADVYPSARYAGIRVGIYDDAFNLPPGPARFAETGTLVLPGFASRRGPGGMSANILDPLDYSHALQPAEAALDFTQRLARHIVGFTAGQPEAYWLWHPIPNDPYLAIAERRHPDLLQGAAYADDEAAAAAVDRFGAGLSG